jgi:hypothetical protein
MSFAVYTLTTNRLRRIARDDVGSDLMSVVSRYVEGFLPVYPPFHMLPLRVRLGLAHPTGLKHYGVINLASLKYREGC